MGAVWLLNVLVRLVLSVIVNLLAGWLVKFGEFFFIAVYFFSNIEKR